MSAAERGVTAEHRPIVLARKPGPLRPLAIDACRISTTDEVSNHARGAESAISKGIYGSSSAQETHQTEGQVLGRWPSNLLLSDPDLFDVANPYVIGSGAVARPGERPARADHSKMTWSGGWGGLEEGERIVLDGGAYSRFFRIPGDDLIGHLTKLVTPPGGVVLDPFEENGVIHTGDCIEVMRTLPENSVDAVCTDPPYGIEFMGKKWDSAKPGGFDKRTRDNAGGVDGAYARLLDRGPMQYVAGHSFQAWCTEWGREALRVTKPGGYLLAFGGCRTHHRLVCGLEDAGWIIRDELTWVYASGFPKGKANLKPAHEPIVLARKPGPLRPLAIDACRIPSSDGFEDQWDKPVSTNIGAGGSYITDGTQHTVDISANKPVGGRWPSNLLLSDPALFDEPNPYVVGSGAVTNTPATYERGSEIHNEVYGAENRVIGAAMNGHGDSGGYSRFFKIPRGEDGGYLTHLDGTICGGEDCSVLDEDGDHPTDYIEEARDYPTHFIIPKAARADREPVLRGQLERGHAGVGIRAAEPGEYDEFVYPAPEGIGRWLRELRETAGMSAKALCAAIGAHGEVNHGGAVSNWEQELNRPTPDQWQKLREVLGFDDRYDEMMTTTHRVERADMGDGSGIPGVSRDPNDTRRRAPAIRENSHPTVKPVDLMRHLVRLVTPSRNEDGEPGLVLDCFLGSGSTALACELEGFRWIGIEKDESYVKIAEARLNGVQRGLGLDVELVGAPRTQSAGKASGYNWEESVNDNPTRIAHNIKSGVHYGDGPQRPPKPAKPVADSQPMWPSDPDDVAMWERWDADTAALESGEDDAA